MATPVVAGTVALMLQANPDLTPNAVKAILQFTAETYPGYDRLTEGAGFLNAKGAVDLATFLASPSDVPYPQAPEWSAQIIWGNRLFRGGRFTAEANAWSTYVTWGDAIASGDQRVVWGVTCDPTVCDVGDDANAWGFSGDAPNIVWGTTCGGGDCSGAWTVAAIGGAVTGAGDDGDTVVWGTSDGDGDTVVWGTSCSDRSCRPVLWGRQ